ncbi:MAG: HAD-IA family hydrolase [archaeon]
MIKIKLLIFDFDGTIARSKTLYTNALYDVLKNNGCHRSKKEVARVLGYRLEVALPMLGIKKKELMERIEKEVNAIALRGARFLTPCPDVSQLNNILGKRYSVLITNSLTQYAMPFVKARGLKFKEVLGSDMFSSKQEAFKKMFKKLGIKPSEAIYIGDRSNDVDVARDAGCKAAIIANRCSWSLREEILKKRPDYLIEGIKDVGKFVN